MSKTHPESFLVQELVRKIAFFSAASQVKQESLGIPTKTFLKVDVESGKLYFKKSKDGPEDKYFVHNKSKETQIDLQTCRFGNGQTTSHDVIVLFLSRCSILFQFFSW